MAVIQTLAQLKQDAGKILVEGQGTIEIESGEEQFVHKEKDPIDSDIYTYIRFSTTITIAYGLSSPVVAVQRLVVQLESSICLAISP